MAKRHNHYVSEKEAIRVRTDACAFAAQVAADRDWDAGRLMALCIFFESYIGLGSKWTERHMHLLRSSEPKQKTVIRLVTRDD